MHEILAADLSDTSLTEIENIVNAEAASINANPNTPNINPAADLAAISTPVRLSHVKNYQWLPEH